MHIGRLGYRDAEAIALDRYLPSGDRVAGGEDPEFVRLLGVERNDGAAAHAQELLHRHAAAAQYNRKFDVDVMDLAFTRHALAPC